MNTRCLSLSFRTQVLWKGRFIVRLGKQQLFISCDHAKVPNRLKIYICESQEVKLEQDGYDFLMTVECPFFDPIICGWKSAKLSSSRLHQELLSHPDTLFSSRNSCCLSLLLQVLLLLLLLQLLLLLLLQPAPAALKSAQDCRREGKFIRPRQRRCWHIRLKISGKFKFIRTRLAIVLVLSINWNN